MVELSDDDARFLARAATGTDLKVGEWEVVPTGRPVENMTTRRLERVQGTLEDGSSWSVFAKSLHPAWKSPMWDQIPEGFRASVLEDLNWLDEPRVYRSALRDGLPDGLRMPAVFRIDQQPSMITMWMEDLPDSPIWDIARYWRAARSLGRLASRWPDERAAHDLGMASRPISRLFFGKICNFDLPILANDEFWDSPVIAAVVDDDYRADLGRLAATTPGLLERLEELPRGMAHGDAAPDNLLEPGDGTLAAIDWSYASVAPVGSDLAQLLAGRVANENRNASQLASLIDTVLDGFVDGLADGGGPVDPLAVHRAFVTYLAVRFVFSALLVEPQDDPTDRDVNVLLRRRAALGRAGLNLALDLADSGAN